MAQLYLTEPETMDTYMIRKCLSSVLQMNEIKSARLKQGRSLESDYQFVSVSAFPLFWGYFCLLLPWQSCQHMLPTNDTLL